jgi:hypothetical protein
MKGLPVRRYRSQSGTAAPLQISNNCAPTVQADVCDAMVPEANDWSVPLNGAGGGSI